MFMNDSPVCSYRSIKSAELCKGCPRVSSPTHTCLRQDQCFWRAAAMGCQCSEFVRGSLAFSTDAIMLIIAAVVLFILWSTKWMKLFAYFNKLLFWRPGSQHAVNRSMILSPLLTTPEGQGGQPRCTWLKFSRLPFGGNPWCSHACLETSSVQCILGLLRGWCEKCQTHP